MYKITELLIQITPLALPLSDRGSFAPCYRGRKATVASGYASTIDESADSDALSNPVLTNESHSVYMDLAIASF
ncbi:hypothetical protein V6N13_019739 [Hibiscus sabdariffa]|uniref:Uncharacterized protein n=1 Tax=Hibiscus sabdariffa TaxID=183260 RepID=A0ABR2NSB8_9ROSI